MPTTFELSRCTFVPVNFSYRDDPREKRVLCWGDGVLTPTNGQARAVMLRFVIRMKDYYRCKDAAELDQLIVEALDEAATLYLEAEETPPEISGMTLIPIEWTP